MDDYAQADEGYSEAPLNSSSTPVAFPLKGRDEPALGFGIGRSSGQFPAWLTQHVANLTVSDRTGKFLNLRIFLVTTFLSRGSSALILVLRSTLAGVQNHIPALVQPLRVCARACRARQHSIIQLIFAMQT